MTEQQQLKDLDVLNELIAELERLAPERTRLVLEHLEGARYYLTGAMPAELALNLNLAEESLDLLHDEALKSRIQQFIQTHRGE
jgi:hypothetical protein